MNRIMIIGGPGDGKSTLARRLSERLGLPVVHMDQFYWSDGWTERAAKDVMALSTSAMQQHSWIFEGNHAASWDARAQRAQLIVYLDLPRSLRMWRILKRTLVFLGRTRPDMGPGCTERFNPEFLKWAWNFDRDERQKHRELLRRWQGERRIVHLKSPQDVRQFLRSPELDNWDIPAIPGVAWA